MSEKTIMPRTELEAAILELYRMLPPPQRKIMMLSAMFSAACNKTVLAEEEMQV